MTKILIVEDQPDIRKLVRMTLEYEQYELHEASEGETGLDMVTTVCPDIVLLDVMMPGSLDGLQVCERVKSNPKTRHTAVILLTARGQQADVQAGRDVGADAYLVKPFSPLELIDKVEELAARRRPGAGEFLQ